MNSIQEKKQQILNVTAFHVLPYSYYQALKKFIKKFCNILDENNIEYWCYGGAVLGKARYNGLLPWDDDFDICIMDTEMDKFNKLTELFKKNNIKFDLNKYPPKIFDLNGFKVNNFYYPFIDIFEMAKIKERKKIFTELENNDNHIIHIKGINKLRWRKHYFYEDEIFPIKNVEIENIQIKFPNNYINYLNRGYNGWKEKIILSNFHVKQSLLNIKQIASYEFNVIQVITNKLNDGKYVWTLNDINENILLPIIFLSTSNIKKFLPNLSLINNQTEKLNIDTKNELIKYLILYHYGGIFTNGKIPISPNVTNLLDELKTYDYININDNIILSRPYSNLFTIFLDDVIEKIINNQTFDIKSLFDKNLENFIKNENYTYLNLKSVD